MYPTPYPGRSRHVKIATKVYPEQQDFDEHSAYSEILLVISSLLSETTYTASTEFTYTTKRMSEARQAAIVSSLTFTNRYVEDHPVIVIHAG